MQVVRFGVQLLAGEVLYRLANDLFALYEETEQEREMYSFVVRAIYGM